MGSVPEWQLSAWIPSPSRLTPLGRGHYLIGALAPIKNGCAWLELVSTQIDGRNTEIPAYQGNNRENLEIL